MSGLPSTLEIPVMLQHQEAKRHEKHELTQVLCIGSHEKNVCFQLRNRFCFDFNKNDNFLSKNW